MGLRWDARALCVEIVLALVVCRGAVLRAHLECFGSFLLLLSKNHVWVWFLKTLTKRTAVSVLQEYRGTGGRRRLANAFCWPAGSGTTLLSAVPVGHRERNDSDYCLFHQAQIYLCRMHQRRPGVRSRAWRASKADWHQSSVTGAIISAWS